MKAKLRGHNTDLQLSYGGHGRSDTREHLEVGKVYEVVVDEHDWHTDYCIDGKSFNSVCFEAVDEVDDNPVNGPDGLPLKLEAIIVDEPNVFICRIGTCPRTTDTGIANVIPKGIDRDDKDRAIAITKRLVDRWNSFNT